MKNLETNLSPEILSKNQEDFKRFLTALYSMENYINHNKFQTEAIIKDYSSMDPRYLSKLSYDYKKRVARLNEAYKLNQSFLSTVASKYKPDPSYSKDISQKEIENSAYYESQNLNWGVFMYISRDWTHERVKERENCYTPIITEVQKYVKAGSKVFIPGSGLLRLGYDLAKLGYNIDANDFNCFNVILCDYIFNYSKKYQFSFQPLIRSFSNYLTEDQVFAKFSFPDENIDLTGKGKMKLTFGDFTQIYNDVSDYYDCVITCFFIDTAKNIFEYVDIIHRVLKKGGIWINLGPLSYHWIGYQEYPTIELPYDKLKEVIINFGFKYLNDGIKNVIYCEMQNNMKNDFYNCIFFTAIKE